MTDANRNPLQIRTVIALVIGAAAFAASIKFLHTACVACTAATLNSPLPAADVIGTIYYCALAAALFRFKLNRFTLLGIYAAAGFHLGLMVKLVELHILCIPCVMCALCVGMAALYTMSRTERRAAVTVLAGLAGMFICSSVYHRWQVHQSTVDTKTAIGFDRLPLKSDGPLPIFVFERSTCHACQEFNELYVPKMSSTYGREIALHINQAPKGITTPTIVVGGTSPVLWAYRPTWRELSTAIDAGLRLSKAQKNPSVAATPLAVVR